MPISTRIINHFHHVNSIDDDGAYASIPNTYSYIKCKQFKLNRSFSERMMGYINTSTSRIRKTLKCSSGLVLRRGDMEYRVVIVDNFYRSPSVRMVWYHEQYLHLTTCVPYSRCLSLLRLCLMEEILMLANGVTTMSHSADRLIILRFWTSFLVCSTNNKVVTVESFGKVMGNLQR